MPSALKASATPTGLPHIAFVAPAAWPVLAKDPGATFTGGAEVQQCLLARALVLRGHRVSMICADHGQPARVEVDGITVVRCPRSGVGIPGVRFFHPWTTGLWSALSEVDADIYYQRTASVVTAVTAAFARLRGRRFIYSAACDLDMARDETWRLFQRRAGWRDRHLFTWGVKHADAIVVQHAGQAADCERWFDRVPVVAPSCYLKPEHARADEKGVVLWVSTIRSLKRPELFLALARRLPQFRFRMVGGPGPEPGAQELYERIKADAREIGNLEFVGFVPHAQVESHFDQARVVVNTSEAEGFPNTFLQAWARGIPTVSFCTTASSVDGHPVGKVASHLESMASSVEGWMNETDSWREAGVLAQRCVEEFHSVHAALRVYERVFADFARGPVVLRRAAAPTPLNT